MKGNHTGRTDGGFNRGDGTQLRVDLKEHMETRLDALKEQLVQRLAAIEQAVGVALAANDKRLDGMNEFRATLRDQASTFIGRT